MAASHNPCETRFLWNRSVCSLSDYIALPGSRWQVDHSVLAVWAARGSRHRQHRPGCGCFGGLPALPTLPESGRAVALWRLSGTDSEKN